MHATLRRILWITFTVSLVSAWWGAFELAYTLWEHGLINSPIWSGALGYPTLHHYIIGFIGAAASITAIQWGRKHEHKIDR